MTKVIQSFCIFVIILHILLNLSIFIAYQLVIKIITTILNKLKKKKIRINVIF